MARMTVPSPRARRIATPSWLDLRLVAGVVLVLACVVVGALVVSRASDTHPVVMVTRDLAAGSVLTPDDLAITQAQLPDDGHGVYLTTLDDAVHRELVRTLSKGELLPAVAIHPVAEHTTLTMPLDPGAAPDLRTGQRIEVWVSTPGCASSVLLAAVTVQGVRVDNGGSFTTGTGGQNVVISVGRALADRVVSALAINDVQLRAGILAGSDSSAAPDDPAGATLPDLTPCAGPSAGR
jgi:hypothetical protein